MKKIIAIILTLVMVLSFTACGSKGPIGTYSDGSSTLIFAKDGKCYENLILSGEVYAYSMGEDGALFINDGTLFTKNWDKKADIVTFSLEGTTAMTFMKVSDDTTFPSDNSEETESEEQTALEEQDIATEVPQQINDTNQVNYAEIYVDELGNPEFFDRIGDKPDSELDNVEKYILQIIESLNASSPANPGLQIRNGYQHYNLDWWDYVFFGGDSGWAYDLEIWMPQGCSYAYIGEYEGNYKGTAYVRYENGEFYDLDEPIIPLECIN